MSECELLDTRPGHCGWCGTKLTGRQTKWCSRHCNRMFVANHRWTQAKAEAKKEAAWHLCANAWRVDERNFDDCTEHTWTGPTGCLVFTQHPEVNHVTPIKGKHGSWGCHHHLIGLEVLCRPCHLRATAKQREEGLL